MRLAWAKYPGIALALFALAGAAACAQAAPRHEPTATPVPEPTATPTPEPTATPTPTPSPTPVVTATAIPVNNTQPEPTVEPTPVGTATAIPVDNNTQTYTLSLQIEGISEESIVYGDTIVLRGQTTADAIVSVKGVIVPVDETGRFEVPLRLTHGGNRIDVVASDLDGNQVSASFFVVSIQEEPGEGQV